MYLLSIVIPCFNELNSLDILYHKAKYITDNYDIQIIFLNNGSYDGTKEKFNSFNSSEKIKFLNIEENKGYGYGIKKVITMCKGEFIGWTHADLQTDLYDLIKAYNLIIQNNNRRNQDKYIIKGVRIGRPLKDQIFSNAMSILGLILFWPKPAYEIFAQPSIFHNSIIDEIQNAPDGYEFDVYVFIVALIKNYNTLRFKVLFPERKNGSSHWNINAFSKLVFINRMFFSLMRIFFYKRLGIKH